MYDRLPAEIIQYIYSFDSTYRDIFDAVLVELLHENERKYDRYPSFMC